MKKTFKQVVKVKSGEKMNKCLDKQHMITHSKHFHSQGVTVLVVELV